MKGTLPKSLTFWPFFGGGKQKAFNFFVKKRSFLNFFQNFFPEGWPDWRTAAGPVLFLNMGPATVPSTPPAFTAGRNVSTNGPAPFPFPAPSCPQKRTRGLPPPFEKMLIRNRKTARPRKVLAEVTQSAIWWYSFPES